MRTKSVTLQLPEPLFIRLQQIAQATQQSFNDVLLRTVQVGSPPTWEDAPAEFQTVLAAMDRLSDEVLWQIARSQQTEDDMLIYQDLLEKNANGIISSDEKAELARLRSKADEFMLRKVHAAALLQWRGYKIPPADKL